VRSRRSHGRRSTGKSRKVEWADSVVVSDDGAISLGDQDVVTAWVKWPSGLVNPNFVELPTEPDDMTLIRTMWWPFATIDHEGSSSEALRGLYWGLIAWDAVDGQTLHEQINPVDFAPDPFYGGYDWILRRTDFDTLGTDADFVNFFPRTEFDSTSRAMRKLPTGTGVLFCLSYHKFGASGDSNITLKFGCQVRYAVKLPW